MDLSFLKDVEVIEVANKARAVRVSLEKTPVDGADFRVYKNGRIFTHPATDAKFNLEFGPKIENENGKLVAVGNGLDVFSSDDWQMIHTPETLLFVAIVPREGNTKIDVYPSCNYAEDGSNLRSINDNVVSTFGASSLVDMLTKVYGVDWEVIPYVDLVINTDFQIKAPREVYSIPKVVSRGKDKGESTFVTRNNIQVFPLTPFIAKEETTVDPNQVDLEDSIAEIQAENDNSLKPSDDVEFTDEDAKDDAELDEVLSPIPAAATPAAEQVAGGINRFKK